MEGVLFQRSLVSLLDLTAFCCTATGSEDPKILAEDPGQGRQGGERGCEQ